MVYKDVPAWPIKGRKAAVVEVQKIVLKEVEVPRPTGRQAVVKITHSGVCHSDLHCFEHTAVYSIFPFPQHPGHEIMGKVLAFGPDVPAEESKELANQSVLVYPWVGCNGCARCADGNYNWCYTPSNNIIGGARSTESGYADYVTVLDTKFLLPAAGIDPSLATILPCAGLTSYSAIKTSQSRAQSTSDGVLAIIGTGGLGLMGIQWAKKLTKQTVVAVDVNDDALKVAKDYGADFVVNPKSTPDVAQFIRDLDIKNKCVEAVVDFVNSPISHKAATSLCVRGTHMIVVGIAGGKTEIQLGLFPLQARSITGIFVGSLPDLKELLELCRKDKGLKTIVTKQLKLDDVGTALEDLQAGKVRGRQILVMDE